MAAIEDVFSEDSKEATPLQVAHDAMVGLLISIAKEVADVRVFTQRDFDRLWLQVKQTGLFDVEGFITQVGLSEKKMAQARLWGQITHRDSGIPNPIPQEEAERRGYMWFALELCADKLTHRSDKRSLQKLLIAQEAEKAVEDYVAKERCVPGSAKEAVSHLPPGLGGEKCK